MDMIIKEKDIYIATSNHISIFKVHEKFKENQSVIDKVPF